MATGISITRGHGKQGNALMKLIIEEVEQEFMNTTNPLLGRCNLDALLVRIIAILVKRYPNES